MNDFYDSKWISSEGTTLTLLHNGTFTMDNFRWDIVYEDLENSIWSDAPRHFTGTWSTGRISNNQCIMFSFEKRGYNLFIENENLIFACIGDPDNCNYYELHRIK